MTSKFIPFDMAKKIFIHPDIFPRIAEDGVTEESIYEGDDDLFVGIFFDGELIGAWWLTAITGTTIDVHVHILPEYRFHKYKAQNQLVALIDKHLPKVHKLQARIPKCFPEVYHFAKKSGMIDEGIEREAKLINKKFEDMWLVGATVGRLLNVKG